MSETCLALNGKGVAWPPGPRVADVEFSSHALQYDFPIGDDAEIDQSVFDLPANFGRNSFRRRQTEQRDIRIQQTGAHNSPARKRSGLM